MKNRLLLEKGNAENLQDFAQAAVDAEFFLDNGDQDVHADRNPDLSPDGVLAGAVEGFDLEVLLDPFEEEFDLPAAFVELWDNEGWQCEIVREEHQTFVGFGIVVTDAPQHVGVLFRSLGPCQANGLVGSQASGLVDRTIGHADVIQIALGSRDEIGQALDKDIQPGEIDIAAIDHVESAWFQNELIEGIDIVNFPVGNVDEAGDRAPQVDQGVEFYRGFVFAESGPWEQRHAQVDGRRIEGVGRFLEIHAKTVRGIQDSRALDQDLSEVGIDFPGARFVGVGQRAPRNLSPESGVIEFGLESAQAGFDIAQAVAERELGESHGEKLIEARKGLHFVVTLISVDARAEFVHRKKIHDLGEDDASLVHWPIPPVWNGQRVPLSSNRLRVA